MKAVVLNGWAMPSSVWDGFFADPSQFKEVHIQNIDKDLDLEGWMELIDRLVDEETVLFGWSLGGMLALSYVASRATKIKGLVTLMANPVFVASDSWPDAMPENVFDSFRVLVESDDYESFARQFSYLVTQGDGEAKLSFKFLRDLLLERSAMSSGILLSGLALLSDINLVDQIPKITVPHLGIWGKNDALCPFSNEIMHLLPKSSSIQALDGVGHFPFGQEMPQIQAYIQEEVLKFAAA